MDRCLGSVGLSHLICGKCVRRVQFVCVPRTPPTLLNPAHVSSFYLDFSKATSTNENIFLSNLLQFYRSFTAAAPPGMAEEDIDLIVRRYSDPAKKGLVNYRALHEDLADLTRHLHREGATRRDPAADYLPPEASVCNAKIQTFMFLTQFLMTHFL